MAELFKTCQACLDAWLSKEGIVYNPAFLDESDSRLVFLDAFNICWHPEKKGDRQLIYTDKLVTIDFNANQQQLVIWLRATLVFRCSLTGTTYVNVCCSPWKEHLTQLVAKLSKELPLAPPAPRPPILDYKLYGGADQDVVPI